MDIDKMKIRRYNNNNRIAVVLFLGGLLFCSINLTLGDDQNTQKETEMEVPESKAAMIIDAVKSMFSLPTRPDHWAFKAKNLYQQGCNYFAPSPNIDFRSGGGDSGAEGATEKVKEAAVKSLDESKATVVGSAKSAAKFTDSAVDKTVKKLKKTLSGNGKDETEL